MSSRVIDLEIYIKIVKGISIEKIFYHSEIRFALLLPYT